MIIKVNRYEPTGVYNHYKQKSAINKNNDKESVPFAVS